jgi:hypothetical protein
MEVNEVVKLEQAQRLEEAQRKAEYWKTAGMAILANDELGAKWCEFVDKVANNEVVAGELLDETLQIMSMIKMNIAPEVIAKTVKQVPGGQTIISAYLGAFIHPEILYGIQSNMDSFSK